MPDRICDVVFAAGVVLLIVCIAGGVFVAVDFCGAQLEPPRSVEVLQRQYLPSCVRWRHVHNGKHGHLVPYHEPEHWIVVLKLDDDLVPADCSKADWQKYPDGSTATVRLCRGWLSREIWRVEFCH